MGLVPGDVRRAARREGCECRHRDVLMVEEQVWSSPQGSERRVGAQACHSLHQNAAADLSFRGQDWAHVRRLPYLLRIDDLGRYSWEFAVLAWLYKSLFRAANRNVVQVARPLDLLQSWIFWRWYRYLPTSDEKGPQLQALRRHLDLMPFSAFGCFPCRTLEVETVLDPCILQEDHEALWCSIVPLIYFGTIEWHQVDWVIPQFGGVQNRPHPILNIDFLQSRDGRGSN
ncbi:hypothetical protein PIB30_030126 [Stylosanthes scabra]|uniref:Aminotransferase-like plant mobile domain-containing protein n=1 Tax=Stylosanthes scabra TaxID=79078 RepID=A0ABU6YBU3_9FABA|nr:hypothetical protein [Stylosanthes scabra]